MNSKFPLPEKATVRRRAGRWTGLVFAGLSALAVLSGCGREPKVAVATATTAAKGIEERFSIRIGDQTVPMQLAVRTEEMMQGLMYRKTMPEDEGMLFVYAGPRRMSFWMHNTEIPLDIGFIDGHGVLKEIYPMYPRDETSVRSRGSDLKFALEMNQGWFARHGVKPGAQLDLAGLARALRARGFKPGEYGANLEAAEKQ